MITWELENLFFTMGAVACNHFVRWRLLQPSLSHGDMNCRSLALERRLRDYCADTEIDRSPIRMEKNHVRISQSHRSAIVANWGSAMPVSNATK